MLGKYIEMDQRAIGFERLLHLAAHQILAADHSH